MARMKAVDAAKYTLVVAEGHEDRCFFCRAVATTKDYTPVFNLITETTVFLDPWVYVHTCFDCWRRIYRANVSVGNGLMTLTQKMALINHMDDRLKDRELVKGGAPKFVINQDLLMLMPKETVIVGESLQIGTRAYTQEEMQELQPAMALVYLKLPAELAFLNVMKNLDPENEPEYRRMLGLEEVERGW